MSMLSRIFPVCGYKNIDCKLSYHDKEAYQDMEAVAMDRHEPNRISVRQNCPKEAVA